MTCLLGLVKNEKVYMAADSGSIYGDLMFRLPSGDEKICQLKYNYQPMSIIMAGAGSPSLFRLAKMKLPAALREPKYTSPDEFMHFDLIPALKQVLKDAAWNWDSPENDQSQLMFNYYENLYTISNTWSASRWDSHIALGHNFFAFGALSSAIELIDDPRRCLTHAMTVAALYDSTISLPIKIMTL